MNRRDFLWLVAVTPALRRAPLHSARAYGLQLYTVRNLMRADMERTLGLVAEAGYAEVEFAGYFGHSAAQIREAVAAVGLRAPGAHIDLETIEGTWPAALDDAVVAGHQFLVLPWIPPALRTAVGYGRLADALDRAGALAAAAGIGLAYHNHDYDHAILDGGTGLDLLLANTDARLVMLELDVFWAVRGGADPVALMDRFPERIRMLHVKDLAADGAMVDVGAGTIDFRTMLRHPAARGAHLFVEHDEPVDPIESARASLRYLHSIEE